jgi:hypothetical protein
MMMRTLGKEFELVCHSLKLNQNCEIVIGFGVSLKGIPDFIDIFLWIEETNHIIAIDMNDSREI